MENSIRLFTSFTDHKRVDAQRRRAINKLLDRRHENLRTKRLLTHALCRLFFTSQPSRPNRFSDGHFCKQTAKFNECSVSTHFGQKILEFRRANEALEENFFLRRIKLGGVRRLESSS